MRLRVLYNPAAGRGRARGKIDLAVRRLEERAGAVDLQISRSAGHLTDLAAETTLESCDRLVICGGDGSLNLTIRRLNLRDIPLAIVPLGSGDDFAQTAGIPRDTLQACDVAVDGVERQFDVAQVNGVRYMGVAGLGFDSEVAEFANSIKHLRGSLVYLYSIFRVLPAFRPHPVRISTNGDGAFRDDEMMFAAIGNTHRYGAGIKIVPPAVPDDAQLDLCLVRRCSRWDLLKALPLAYSGRHVTKPFVILERADSFTFHSERKMRVFADGEPLGETPATLTIAPERLRVIVPRGNL
jgi:diacylglycerol kinase (ATP)